MHLKETKEGYMRGFRDKKEKRGIQLYYNLKKLMVKVNSNNKFRITYNL